MNKPQRARVLQRFGGLCAYCGKRQATEVDHIQACRRGKSRDSEFTDDELMPACKRCNYRKHTFTVEEFREQIALQPGRLQKLNGAVLAMDYGLVAWTSTPVVFYFERLKETP